MVVRSSTWLCLLVALLLCFGCDTSQRSLIVPSHDGGAAIIVAVTDRGPLFVWAWEKTPATQRSFPELAGIGEFRLYRLAYDVSLADLDLPEGELPLGPVGGRELKPPPTLSRSDIQATTQSAWVELDVMPKELEAVRLDLPKRSDCLPLGSHDVSLQRDGILRFVIPLGGQRVLAGFKNAPGDNLRVADPTGARAVHPAGLPPDARLRGGFRDVHDVTWLLGETVLWRGDVDTGFVATASVSTEATGRVILFGPDDPSAPEELFIWTSRRELYRYADGRVSLLGSLPPRGDGDGDKWPAAAWLGPGEVLATGDDPSYLHYADGRARISEDNANYNAFRRLANGRVFAGASFGLLRTWGAGEWQDYARIGDARNLVIGDLPGGGLIVGGERGVLSQYFSESGEVCEHNLAGSTVSSVTPIEDGFVLKPHFNSDGDMALTFVSY